MSELKPLATTPLDTGPLELEQLSDQELATILQIERRLYEVRASSSNGDSVTQEVLERRHANYLASAQVRHPRVLMLDGDRGTGKTSLFLTLVHRWTPGNVQGVQPHDERQELYRERIKGVRRHGNFVEGEHDFEIPKHVYVVGKVLDFDPLPARMPLIAGLIQAWRPLCEHLDQLSRSNRDDAGETLMDRWHRLFRVAAVGWADLPQGGGLLSQVLDQQEQVADWQRLDEQWRHFVDDVLARWGPLSRSNGSDERPVFVIMIDDVDLQVERIRELLPALRLLYYPSVYILVAADYHHMRHVLTLDYLGRQNKLTHADSHAGANVEWASHLAKSSSEKVFPLANRWTLHALSLGKLLRFPNDQTNLRTLLNHWTHHGEMASHPAGDYLRDMTSAAKEVVRMPRVASYRSARQVFDRISTLPESDLRGVMTAHYLFAASDPSAESHVVDRGMRGMAVEYTRTGELTAHFHSDLSEPISQADVVLSARPDFLYRPDSASRAVRMTTNGDGDVNFTTALAATSLREDGYNVVSGLRWDVRLALAWTRVRLFDPFYEDPNYDLSFQWKFHEHPSPKRLFEWTRDWEGFIRGLQGSVPPAERVNRIGYAWVYYNLKWLSGDVSSVPNPLSDSLKDGAAAEASWEAVLRCDPNTGTREERENWRARTLPLLARPELGLSPELQGKLLQFVRDTEDRGYLFDQRRRLVTDAILADDEVNAYTKEAEDQARVGNIISIFDNRHIRSYGSKSPWLEIVEDPLTEERRKVTNLPAVST